MFQPRSLGRRECQARHAATGGDNLAAAVGEWHRIGPRHEDEIWSVSGMEVLLAGRNLLGDLGGIGTRQTALEFRLMLRDGFGVLRDLNRFAAHTTQTAAEWRAGQHNGTVVDTRARSRVDNTHAAGLRGNPTHPGATADWKGPESRVRYGRRIGAACWDVDALLDTDGNPIDSAGLVLRTGVDNGAGAIAWTDHPVASTGAELVQGHYEFPAPVVADLVQWVARLAFVDADATAHSAEAIRRTSILLVVGEWVELDDPVWRFDSLAALINQSDDDRLLRANAWEGNKDTVLLRLPMTLELDGRLGESVSVRLASADLAGEIAAASVFAVADVAFVDDG